MWVSVWTQRIVRSWNLLLLTQVTLQVTAKQTPPYHKPSHSLLLNPLLLLLLLSVCDRVIAHHRPVQLHHLGLDGAMVFSEVTSMLQDCVKIFLVFLSSFALLLHLLLFLKFFCDSEGYRWVKFNFKQTTPANASVFISSNTHTDVHNVHVCIYSWHTFVHML